MKITEIRLRNFRCFSKVKIHIQNSDTVILGENGSGKTNLFRALRLVLDNKYSYPIKKEDYPIQLKNIQSHWIIIQVKLSDVDTKELGQFGTKLNPNEHNEAWINLFFRPIYDERIKMKEFADAILKGNKTQDEFKLYLDSLDFRTDYEIIRTLGETPDYTEDDEYESLVGKIDSYNLLINEEDDVLKIGNRRGASDIIRNINVIFVPAGRDPYEEMTGVSGIIKNIIKKQAKQIDKSKLSNLRDDLSRLAATIESFDEFKDIGVQISNKYKEALGEINYKKTNVSSLISDELNDVVRYLGLNIEDNTSILPLAYRSLGEHSIFHLVLRIVDGESSDKTKFTLLLVEEPEVHLHTHLQRTLFIKLQNKNDMQLMFSTHSNNISYATHISKMIIMENRSDNVNVYYPSKNLDDIEISKTERYLDANRTPLLFAKKVLLVEGDAEAIILPWLFSEHYNYTLDEYCISLIKVDSAFFEKISILFHEDRIRRFCYILTDRDADYSESKKYAGANAIGLNRYNTLIELKDSNKFILPHFCNNTFEIQLIEKNIEILKNMLDKKLIYKQKQKILDMKNNLDSSNIELKYDTILECVNYIKKGWFALSFVDYCQKNKLKPQLPDYIKNAFDEMVKTYDC